MSRDARSKYNQNGIGVGAATTKIFSVIQCNEFLLLLIRDRHQMPICLLLLASKDLFSCSVQCG